MGYPTPHTWVVGDAWPVTDANTYIRDAFTSVRRYQNSTVGVYDSGSPASGGFAALGSTHYNLMSSTPDEAYRMHVIISGVLANGDPTNPDTCSFRILDQAGGTLNLSAGIPNWSQLVIANSYTTFSVAGSGSYAAGSNNGFVLQAGTVTLTMLAVYHAVVIFSPQV